MADLLLSLTHLCPPLPSSALLCPPLPSLPSLLLPSAQVCVPRLAVSSIISTSYSDVAMLDLAFGQSIHTEAGLEYVLCRVDGRLAVDLKRLKRSRLYMTTFFTLKQVVTCNTAVSDT